MTRVDFYISSSTQTTDFKALVRRLVEKIYKLNHHVLLLTENEKDCEHLDEELWTYNKSSFLPHHPFEPTLPEPPIVLLTADKELPMLKKHEVLINLSSQVPLFFSHFERTVEIVYQQPQYAEAARERYRFYKERGYPLHSHKI